MINKKKKYKLGDFNYQLPKTFIAQHPEARRDYSKLMVVHKDTGEIVTEMKFPEVPGSDAVLEAADKFYKFVNGK